MKKIFLFTLISLLSIGLFADEWVKINSDQPMPADIQLVQSNISTTTLQFNLEGFWKKEVETEQGTALLLSVENGSSMLQNGAPDLPVFTSSILVPDQSEMKVKVIRSEFIQIKNVLVAPSKGNLSRQIDPSTVPYEFGKPYAINRNFPGEVAIMNEPYIIRDFRGQALQIRPFQYNPVTRTLTVYYNIEIKVIEDGVSSSNIIEREKPLTSIDAAFSNVYQRHFINYNSSSRYDPVEEEGNMIIISYGDFMDEIQPLADWKIKKGTPCSVVDVAEIGGVNDIKQFIQNAYDFTGLTFVLLVGDAAQVPSSTIQGDDSDNDYTYVDGNDHYPDLFIGRFSAETEAHVTTMVNRTLEYETDPVSDTAWYTKAIGIASNEGPGDDNEMDYEHIRNIANNKLLPFTYNYAYEFFEGSQGGEDAPGNPTSGMVANAVNTGATIINYTGHGSTTAWSTSGFNVNNVNNLTNTGFYPFIISVACVNGNFVNYTCFAEAWTRATDNGEPTGAIATIMSTVNQSWNPPMCGQDEMNDILTEAFEDNIKRTFGGITMNGCMEMNDVYGSNGSSETDYWTIFGDPSLVVRTAIPADMTATHETSLPLGTSELVVTCDAEGGLVALSLDGDILATAYVEDGEVTLEFDALDTPGTADIVVTAFNYRPYISTVEVVPTAEPYITYANHIINDSDGNGNGMVDYTESIFMTVDLTNIGEEDAAEVMAEISSTSPFVTLEVTGANYGTIAVGDTVAVEDGFSFTVTEDVPDGEAIEFMVQAEDMAGRSIWESVFSLTAHAPVLNFVEFTIDDTNGNGNGRLDPGEDADLVINIANVGSSEAYNIISQLTTVSEYVSIANEQEEIGDLEGGASSQVIFQVSADGDTPDGHSATFDFQLLADHNITGNGEFFTNVGQKPVYVWNLAAASTSSDSIAACMNTLQVGADFGTQMPENMELYRSIFVILGVYPDNHQLSNEEGAALASFLDNGGCIYMEGGDTWAFDDKTAVHPMFFIEGLNDGDDNVSTIAGEKETFLDGYQFAYEKYNNYIDQIAPMEGASLLMSNMDPEFGTAVSYANDNYKTIGSSVIFAGLVDEGGSTKDGMIAEILYFFGIGFTWTDVSEFALNEATVTAYPNPFKNQVTIRFSLIEKSNIAIDVFDLTGRKVTTLANQLFSAGMHEVNWNANDQSSRKLEPGIYFYRLTFDDQSITRKIILSR